jgi:uncharacterized membrane protein YccC
MGAAVLLGTGLATFYRDPHPYWVPLSVAAVLQGPSGTVAAARTIDRVQGTVLGLALAAALLIGHPGVWVSLGLVVALQMALLLTVVRNYAIAVMFITALAFVVIFVGKPLPLWPLVSARFFDTLIGAALGIAAVLTLFPEAASRRLPSLLGQTLVDTARTLEASTAEARRYAASLTRRLSDLRSTSDLALNELPANPEVARLWPAVAAAEELGFRVAAMVTEGERPQGADVPNTSRTIRTLADLAEGTHGDTPAVPQGSAILTPPLKRLVRSLRGPRNTR